MAVETRDYGGRRSTKGSSLGIFKDQGDPCYCQCVLPRLLPSRCSPDKQALQRRKGSLFCVAARPNLLKLTLQAASAGRLGGWEREWVAWFCFH